VTLRRDCSRRLAGLLVLSSALIVATGGDALAAPGDLDRSFGGDGKVTSNFTRGDDVGRALAIQSDGMIVVVGNAGSFKFALERLKPDGTLDSTFGTGGKVVTEFVTPPPYDPEVVASAVAIQGDGRIVAAGGAGERFALARYNADGTLDSTFGEDGKVTTAFPGFPYGFPRAYGVAIQADGKIVAGGIIYATQGPWYGAFALVRYNPDGTLDSSFDEDGRVITEMASGNDSIAAVAIQADGRILAAGKVDASVGDSEFGLARYEPDGTLDSTFGGDGMVTTSFGVAPDGASDLVIQPDGRIVAAGFAGGHRRQFGLARYNTDGTLDSTFGGDGKVTTNFTAERDAAYGLALQATGKIVAAGRAAGTGGRFALARYHTDGTLDSTFGGDGKVTTNFTEHDDSAFDVAVQANGRIVAAGREAGKGGRFALARYRAG
jgi:uncharacterized delta-60 repeat protein